MIQDELRRTTKTERQNDKRGKDEMTKRQKDKNAKSKSTSHELR